MASATRTRKLWLPQVAQIATNGLLAYHNANSTRTIPIIAPPNRRPPLPIPPQP